MSKEHLVIIGGVAAGLAAAMQARRETPALDITVLEKTRDISYGACGLPYVISGLITSLDELVLHTPDYFREKHNIEVRLRHEVVEILPAKSIVRLRLGEGGEEREAGYHKLIIACGAAAVCPPLPGHRLAGVFVLRHLQDGRRMLRYIEEVRPRAAVVVGAGYIGLEMAEAFRERGFHTTLIESSDRVMSIIDGDVRDRVVDELRAHDIEVIFGEKVVAFEGRGERLARVITETGRALDAEIAAIGVGVKPDIEMAQAAGLEIGDSGAILTDTQQRTSVANIYAAGDCSTALHLVSGERVWHPLGQPAVRQGWVAGANASGAATAPEARHAGIVGTNVVKVFRLEVARTGLSLAEAQNHGFDAVSVESETASRAGYYPSGTKILTRIVADRSGRLLGAQMVGREGAAQRIDVYAAALHSRLKVEDVERFDLAYAPPYAPTIDPILRAAYEAKNKPGV